MLCQKTTPQGQPPTGGRLFCLFRAPKTASRLPSDSSYRRRRHSFNRPSNRFNQTNFIGTSNTHTLFIIALGEDIGPGLLQTNLILSNEPLLVIYYLQNRPYYLQNMPYYLQNRLQHLQNRLQHLQNRLLTPFGRLRPLVYLHAAVHRVPLGAVGDPAGELAAERHVAVRARVRPRQVAEGGVIRALGVLRLARRGPVPRVVGHQRPLVEVGRRREGGPQSPSHQRRRLRLPLRIFNVFLPCVHRFRCVLHRIDQRCNNGSARPRQRCGFGQLRRTESRDAAAGTNRSATKATLEECRHAAESIPNFVRDLNATRAQHEHCRMDCQDLIKPSCHSREDSILPSILHGRQLSVSSPSPPLAPL
eukprot:1190113-Prorocentrum_minimum.AAC.1